MDEDDQSSIVQSLRGGRPAPLVPGPVLSDDDSSSAASEAADALDEPPAPTASPVPAPTAKPTAKPKAKAKGKGKAKA